MGSRLKIGKNTRTISGVPRKALQGSPQFARFVIRSMDALGRSQDIVMLMCDDFEIAFDYGEAVAFRRKAAKYRDAGARFVSAALPDKGYKPIATEVFRRMLFDNMLIALRRVMAPHDIVAESSELGGAIAKTLDELGKIAEETTDDPMELKEAVLAARMRLFSRYVGLDKRRRKPEDRQER